MAGELVSEFYHLNRSAQLGFKIRHVSTEGELLLYERGKLPHQQSIFIGTGPRKVASSIKHDKSILIIGIYLQDHEIQKVQQWGKPYENMYLNADKKCLLFYSDTVEYQPKGFDLLCDVKSFEEKIRGTR